MKVSVIFLTLLTIIGGYHAFTGVCFAADEQDAISARLFTEGKIWHRIVTAPPESLEGLRHKIRTVTASFRVISGYSEKSPMPEEIVIEVSHPGIYKEINPYRVVLSPGGSFLCYRLYGYEKPYSDGTNQSKKWYDYYHVNRNGFYNKRIYIATNSALGLHYVFLPLPILWKNSSFETNKD